MSDKITIVGNGSDFTPQQWHELQLKYPDAEFITPEEARERSLQPHNISNETIYPFTARGPLPTAYATTVFNRGGKNILSARNQRRLAERKNKKGK